MIVAFPLKSVSLKHWGIVNFLAMRELLGCVAITAVGEKHAYEGAIA